MPGDINLKDLHESIKIIREINEKNQTKIDGLDLEKMQKATDFADKYEEKNLELVKKLEAEKKSRLELEENYKNLEIKLKDNNFFNGKKEEATQELKSFDTFIKKGEKSLDNQEFKALRTDSSAQGGFLIPQSTSNEIIKNITEISAIDSLARVVNMGTKTEKIPVRSTLVSVGMVGERQSDKKSNSSYGSIMLEAKKGQVTVEADIEYLQDVGIDAFAEIRRDVVEAMSQLRGRQFVNGDNSPNQCQGFMKVSGLTEVRSGDATGLTFDSLIDLTGSLKSAYNPTYGMNRRTIAAVRKLKSGNGEYIWRAGNLGAGVPNQINGDNYVEIPDMPDIAAGSYPIVYADFFRGYRIGNRSDISIIRDDYTQKQRGIVEFTFFTRFGGVIALREAFSKLKIST